MRHTTAAVLQYVELYSLLVIPAVEHVNGGSLNVCLGRLERHCMGVYVVFNIQFRLLVGLRCTTELARVSAVQRS